MTSCGETSERLAAVLHGTVAALYVIMLLWHGASVIKHLSRDA
jgi:hypothetical protein